MKVKLRQEIVSLGIAGVDPEHLRGRYVEPEDWNAEISRPDTLVLDVAINMKPVSAVSKTPWRRIPGRFASFPITWKKTSTRNNIPGSPCTVPAGIRCEKASSYLLSRGFREVVQLQGGILNYLEKVERNDSRCGGETVSCSTAGSPSTMSLRRENTSSVTPAAGPVDDQDDMASEKYLPGVSCPAVMKT